MTKRDFQALEYAAESSMLGDKPNDISQFQVLRDCYDGPTKVLPVPPPIGNPTHWRDKLDEAEQEGYLEGYADADALRPLQASIIFAIGILTGLLTGFFLFYRG